MGDRLGIQVAVDILPSFLTPDVKMNISWYPWWPQLHNFFHFDFSFLFGAVQGRVNSQKMPCPRWGSNSRPSDYETDALPTALRRLLSGCSVGFSLGTHLGGIFVKKFLSEVGFEPTPSSEDQKSPLIPYLGTRFKPWVWRLRPLGHPDIGEKWSCFGGNQKNIIVEEHV